MLLNNRYQVLKSVGSGGFGETFLAEDTQIPSKRRCLIKRLHPVNNDPNTQQLIHDRFDREAAILEDLGDGSDQIPSLYAYFEENKNFYLVQELIEGKTLSQVLQEKGSLSETAARKIVISLLEIIRYVHSKRIVHRDINPDNIIIRDYDNKPVLIDFGAVKESMGTTITTSGNVTASIVIGTPGFMPSEQIAGRPVYSSDLYSIGLTGVYMLTGRLPQVIETDPNSGQLLWKQYAPRVSPTLASILDKATHSSYRERFSNAQEMLLALQQKTIQHSVASSPTLAVSPGSSNSGDNKFRVTENTTRSSPRLGDLRKTILLSGFLAIAIISGVWITNNPAATPPISEPQPNPEPIISEEDLQGIWYSENSCINPDRSTFSYEGTTEFFRNQSFTFIGEMIIGDDSSGSGGASITFDVIATGEWELAGEILVSKIIDLRSQPTFIHTNDRTIDVQELGQTQIRQIPNLENFIPTGLSSEEFIVELTPEQFITEIQDTSCNSIVEYIRRNRPFR